ncbi:MAG: hypothetical protein Q9200_006579, partial [Gallowayella weberi]
MPDSQTHKISLDDAASIKAFLSKISQAGNPATSSSKTEELINNVGKLDINHEKTTDATNIDEANSPVAGAIPGRTASNVASSELKASDATQTVTVSDRVHLNVPADHFKSKNPVLTAVQAQDSPRVSGVMAPPPTPEAAPNLAIGQLFMNALDDIPQDRILSLGDSIHAPKNLSQMRNSRSAAANPSNSRFFSPVPQSCKPRDDPTFTRMSFKAAETPSAPIFNLSNARNKPPENIQMGPPSATNLKENVRLGKSIDASSQTDAPDRSNIYAHITAHMSPAAAPITSVKLRTAPTPDIQDKPSAAATVKGTTNYNPDTPKTPPPAPRLKPAPADVVTASEVTTPDVPDRPLDVSGKSFADERTPLQSRPSRVNIFATDNVCDPIKQDKEKTKPSLPSSVPDPKKQEKQEHTPVLPAVVPKLSGNVTTGGVDFDEPDRPQSPGGVLLTPSSMALGAVSPRSVKKAGTKTASMPGKVVAEDLEGALYFKAWPKNEERTTRTAARVRKILLTGIPTGASPTLVASFVFGGPLEQIQVNEKSAYVTFLRGQDAEKYYEATGNGLLYQKDDVEHVIMMEMTREVNPVSGILREYIEKEFTRCVRANGVDKDWTMKALHETAARKGRRVEKIVDGLNASKFRFCDIADAVKFKQTLSRSEDWEECNVHFAPDP